MVMSKKRQAILFAGMLCVGFIGSLNGIQWLSPSSAADHGDAPGVAHDQGVDIGDVYAFLDPNDNNFLCMILTSRGFIVPTEAGNFGFFQSSVNTRFEIENSGDAVGDINIDVGFSARTSPTTPQTAFVKLRRGATTTASFTGLTTFMAGTATAPPPFVVTTDPVTNISLYAGISDDPFFFDIAGEVRFRNSARAGSPDVSVLARGRDSFAGYNTLAVALRVPVALLAGPSNVIGVSGNLELPQATKRSRNLGSRGKGRFVTIDRMATPAANIVFTSFGRKDEFNRASPSDDKAGLFAADIVANATALRTNAANINILAGIVVSNGDYLRVDLIVPNTGTGGGSNPQAAFPNGRRLRDDVIDTLVNIYSNQLFGSGPVDNVNANDVPLTDTFPFLGLPQIPRASGDDNTRN